MRRKQSVQRASNKLRSVELQRVNLDLRFRQTVRSRCDVMSCWGVTSSAVQNTGTVAIYMKHLPFSRNFRHFHQSLWLSGVKLKGWSSICWNLLSKSSQNREFWSNTATYSPALPFSDCFQPQKFLSPAKFNEKHFVWFVHSGSF